MRLTQAAKNTMLNALDESQAAGMKYASLHSAYSTTGANELAGGSPPYARKAVVWDPAASGVKALNGTAVFDVAGGSTIRFVGFWIVAVGGTPATDFLGMTPNGGGVPQAFVVPDATADVLECVAHGFVNTDAVTVWAVPGDPLPGGLTEGAIYYVINATTDDLQLSLTSGGAAAPITSIGAGTLQKVVVETFGAQGTHTISSASVALD